MSSRFNLRYAAQICLGGGVIAYPTESVYGLGCDPLDETAVQRILSLKQREVEKGVILISDDIHKLIPFIVISPQQQTQIIQQQDKPTTWLVPASELTPFWIRGSHKKVAVRITQHRVARALCAELPWPIVSTSANPAGLLPARNAIRVQQYFKYQLDDIVAGAVNKLGSPSVIRDLDSNQIIRA